MKKVICALTLCMAYEASAAKWNKINNPSNFNIIAKDTMKFSLTELPLSAKLQDDRLGWSETFWPSNKGGIAYRWNHPNPQPFKYRMHTKQELMRMSEAELSQLSPAELYDIAQGDYKYTLTKRVLGTYKKEDLWWEGICHGWALAATNYPEPDKNVVTNKDGIKVPFGASDVKGLLAMHDAFNSKGLYAQVGSRCAVYGKVPGEAFPEDGDVPEPKLSDANSPDCADINAGAFHVVLTNMIGIHSKGFVAEVDRFNDVWNQPVVSYDSQIVEEMPVSSTERSDGIFRKVKVKTTMTYGDELEFYTPELEAEYREKGEPLGFVSKDPVTATDRQVNTDKNYEYVLELDNVDRIVGGEWISKTRPDFIWSKTKDNNFTNNRGGGFGFGGRLARMFMVQYPLSGLNKIYKPVKH